ncbi:MAG TPA: hypothetical protein DHU55_00140, partial [Blastocatellia bacterium]|nr:hypothetical protein [Blastocatellia bacterium]
LGDVYKRQVCDHQIQLLPMIGPGLQPELNLPPRCEKSLRTQRCGSATDQRLTTDWLTSAHIGEHLKAHHRE